ncbi:hypothetical protein [Ruminiclostridium josui]|nr:hypothetical protein [Ruminiclostridium josui]
MSNKILTTDGWEKRIQDKLGVDPVYLPNEAINQPDIITVAEANIIAQLPDYSILEDNARVYLEAAVVSECSRLICPSLPARLPAKENGPHESHELSVDWTKKQKDFEVERDEYIGKVIELAFPEKLTSSLIHFTITKPRRW